VAKKLMFFLKFGDFSFKKKGMFDQFLIFFFTFEQKYTPKKGWREPYSLFPYLLFAS
jgi:hypothetical protein